MTPLQALEAAIHKAGGVSALATQIGSTQSTVSMWRKRMSERADDEAVVPAEHCPAIERETGVKCELLNPRVSWATLRLS